MQYQVSVALKTEDCLRTINLLKESGFTVYLKDTALDVLGPIELIDQINLSKESDRFYIYGIFNSSLSFPPQEDLKKIMENEHLLDIRLRHFTGAGILPS